MVAAVQQRIESKEEIGSSRPLVLWCLTWLQLLIAINQFNESQKKKDQSIQLNNDQRLCNSKHKQITTCWRKHQRHPNLLDLYLPSLGQPSNAISEWDRESNMEFFLVLMSAVYV
jgi:hypothetical protein